MPTRFPALSAIVLVLSCGAASAAERSFRADYTLSYMGVTLGKSSFRSVYDGKGYTLESSFGSAGLASMVADTSGKASVRGRVGKDGAEPHSFVLTYASGRKKGAVRIAFEGGKAVQYTVSPPPRATRAADYIALTDGMLVAVADPLSGAIVSAANPSDLCRRTIRLFDGETRADLVLSPKGTGTFRTVGFSGETVRCTAKIRPVAGYRKKRRDVATVAASTGTIDFAPVGVEALWAPVAISLSTGWGPVSVTATRFGAD